jgi:hypothetical protein
MYSLYGEGPSLTELYGEDVQSDVADVAEKYGISPGEAIQALMGNPYLMAGNLKSFGKKLSNLGQAIPGITSGLSQGKSGIQRGWSEIQDAIKGNKKPPAPPEEEPAGFNFKPYLLPAVGIAAIIGLKILLKKKKRKGRK